MVCDANSSRGHALLCLVLFTGINKWVDRHHMTLLLSLPCVTGFSKHEPLLWHLEVKFPLRAVVLADFRPIRVQHLIPSHTHTRMNEGTMLKPLLVVLLQWTWTCAAHSTESYINKVHPLISNRWGHNNDGEIKLLLSNVPSVSGEEGVIQTCFCCLPAHLCVFLEKSWEEVINRWQHWSVRPTDVYVWRVKRTVHHYSQHFQWKM